MRNKPVGHAQAGGRCMRCDTAMCIVPCQHRTGPLAYGLSQNDVGQSLRLQTRSACLSRCDSLVEHAVDA